METNLAQLEGTPKQIAWAEKIRAFAIEKINQRKRPWPKYAFHPHPAPTKEEALQAIASIRYASFFIISKTESPRIWVDVLINTGLGMMQK